MVYENVKAVLHKSGAAPRDIVKVTFYCVDYSLEQGEILIKPFVGFLADENILPLTHRPITTMVPVPKLAYPDAKLEVEVFAVIDAQTHLYPVPALRSTERFMLPRKVDVVVVGGGEAVLEEDALAGGGLFDAGRG